MSDLTKLLHGALDTYEEELWDSGTYSQLEDLIVDIEDSNAEDEEREGEKYREHLRKQGLA